MDYKPWIFSATGHEKPPQKLTAIDGLTIPTGGIGFFSPDECAEILNLTDEVVSRQAMTSDGVSKGTYTNRESMVREVYPHPSLDWVFRKLEAALIQLNNQQYQFDVHGFFEGAQVYDYPVGGHLGWHMDIAKGYMSMRKLSMSVQLTDGNKYQGGNLEFADFNEVAPRGLGDLIVFPSFLRHRVTALTSGQRRCWVSWVHGPPYR